MAEDLNELAMSLAQSLAERSGQMQIASTMPNSQPPTQRDESVRQALRRAAELTRAAADVGRAMNPTALSILSRALLENLIVIAWVVMSEENAQELKETALEELARLARINLQNGNARIVNKDTGEDATEKFLAGDQFKKSLRRRSVEQRAREANVYHLYDVFYRYLSMETHGHKLASERSPEAVSESVMHMQGFGALCTATGHVGVLWLVHRRRADNEDLRKIFGFDRSA